MTTDYAILAGQYNMDVYVPSADFMVTVGELRKGLARFPDEAYVILRKDAEGNGHSPLASNRDGMPDVGPVWYHPESTWGGETYVIGEDVDGEVFEPSVGEDVFAVELGPVN